MDKQLLDELEQTAYLLASTIDAHRNMLFKNIDSYWTLREPCHKILDLVRQVKVEAGLPLLIAESYK